MVAAKFLAFLGTLQQFIVSTDVSTYAVEAVLSQKVDSVERPVAFEGRKLRVAELNYPVRKRELLIVIHALHKWHYISDRSFDIEILRVTTKVKCTSNKVNAVLGKFRV